MFVIMDNYDSFTYNLYQSLALLAPDIEVIRNDKITVEALATMNPEGIILSPGPGRPEEAGICIELVQRLHESFPIFGVCLGHQSIVEAFGGQVIQCDEIVHGKQTQVFHNRAGMFASVALPFEAGRYHSLIAEKSTLPDELTITAENESGIIMGIEHKIHPVFGVQFHPESILTPCGDELIHHFVRFCRNRKGQS